MLQVKAPKGTSLLSVFDCFCASWLFKKQKSLVQSNMFLGFHWSWGWFVGGGDTKQKGLKFIICHFI